MATFESSRRVGRSQAAVIFWGLISVFFATGFCYYFMKNREDEKAANSLRGQVMTLQDQRDVLASQKNQLEASASETSTQLNTREEFLNEKEAKLAQEESQLDARGQQSVSQSQQNLAQAGIVRKFNDAVKKLTRDGESDAVIRGGRPVLRVPSSVFFGFGDATLKPGGKAVLNQIAAALNGDLGTFELRVETFTDNGGETGTADPAPKSTDSKPADTLAPLPPAMKTEWALSGARAAAIAQFLRQSSPLPYQNVLVVLGADTQPIVVDKEGHARNRRVEITVTPLPVSYHPPAAEEAATSHSKTGDHPKTDHTKDRPATKPDHNASKSDEKPAAKSSTKTTKEGDKPKADGGAHASKDSTGD